MLTRSELLSCVELGKVLTSELQSDQLYLRILQKVSELLPAENWSMLLLDEETGELRFELSVGLDPDQVKDVRLGRGQGVAGQVAQSQKPMVIQDVRECDFFCKEVDRITGFTTKSIVCVPLIFGGKTLGVLEVVNARSLKGRTLDVLMLVADYAAIAVENMRRYREIQDLVIHDDLTGLYNTRHLYRVLKDLVESAQTGEDPFAVIFMDIDDFKHVVDTYGHLKGSQAISEIAGTIKECLTAPCFGVAYGGDEFIVVLPGFSKNQAMEKAEEIRSRMKKTLYLSNHGHKLNLRASFGIASFPDDASNVTALLASADRAMFHIKRKGKDAVKPA